MRRFLVVWVAVVTALTVARASAADSYLADAFESHDAVLSGGHTALAWQKEENVGLLRGSTPAAATSSPPYGDKVAAPFKSPTPAPHGGDTATAAPHPAMDGVEVSAVVVPWDTVTSTNSRTEAPTQKPTGTTGQAGGAAYIQKTSPPSNSETNAPAKVEERPADSVSRAESKRSTSTEKATAPHDEKANTARENTTSPYSEKSSSPASAPDSVPTEVKQGVAVSSVGASWGNKTSDLPKNSSAAARTPPAERHEKDDSNAYGRPDKAYVNTSERNEKQQHDSVLRGGPSDDKWSGWQHSIEDKTGLPQSPTYTQGTTSANGESTSIPPKDSTTSSTSDNSTTSHSEKPISSYGGKVDPASPRAGGEENHGVKAADVHVAWVSRPAGYAITEAHSPKSEHRDSEYSENVKGVTTTIREESESSSISKETTSPSGKKSGDAKETASYEETVNSGPYSPHSDGTNPAGGEGGVTVPRRRRASGPQEYTNTETPTLDQSGEGGKYDVGAEGSVKVTPDMDKSNETHEHDTKPPHSLHDETWHPWHRSTDDKTEEEATPKDNEKTRPPSSPESSLTYEGKGSAVQNGASDSPSYSSGDPFERKVTSGKDARHDNYGGDSKGDKYARGAGKSASDLAGAPNGDKWNEGPQSVEGKTGAPQYPVEASVDIETTSSPSKSAGYSVTKAPAPKPERHEKPDEKRSVYDGALGRVIPWNDGKPQLVKDNTADKSTQIQAYGNLLSDIVPWGESHALFARDLQSEDPPEEEEEEEPTTDTDSSAEESFEEPLEPAQVEDEMMQTTVADDAVRWDQDDCSPCEVPTQPPTLAPVYPHKDDGDYEKHLPNVTDTNEPWEDLKGNLSSNAPAKTPRTKGPKHPQGEYIHCTKIIGNYGESYECAPNATVSPTPAPTEIPPLDKTCTDVSVEGDATYCIDGPICSGSGSTPAGSLCPVEGDVAVKDCSNDKLPSWTSAGACVAPSDATCVRIKTGAWGCVYGNASNATTDSSAGTETPTESPSEIPTETPGESTPGPSEPTPASSEPSAPSQSTPAPSKPNKPGEPTPASSEPNEPTAPGEPTPAPSESNEPGEPTPAPSEPNEPGEPTPAPSEPNEPGEPTPAPTKAYDEPTPTPAASTTDDGATYPTGKKASASKTTKPASSGTSTTTGTSSTTTPTTATSTPSTSTEGNAYANTGSSGADANVASTSKGIASDGSAGLSGGGIAGIVIACIVFVAVVVGAVLFKQRSIARQREENLFADLSAGGRPLETDYAAM
ncbi:hypothetical protein PHYPSEUDO_014058 [Phytophthora pseudosyringae]|uniref:Uncharacterized protein n=1 Tax=Phytophthora pseudosyringae TaxID=221518 RepID=A0A8T1V7B5_9STRA|nr:hypothetical protein PHYPSEUDO_014058 [Phytophthora pseudosyringae]